jgi:hypothetical protein
LTIFAKSAIVAPNEREIDMVTEFKIEKNIPLSPSGSGRATLYPFAALDVGDSFLVPNADRRTQQKLSTCGQYHARRRGLKFATRSVDGGVRVWRVA